ncbi:hypothetical protein Cgig2_015701 [Carnegiea gigantea]|uniref:Uncharacterized protein n=1 Tax=Carnegiea gigantea TaxID=171969 RepID=A0A9Q1K052_9CARY|nr:hypothetical protein Cgig2_015701 [Carnegiea gigantea]
MPTMVLCGKEALQFASPHNDPLVIEMKIASAIVRQILIDTGSSIDIMTWDCLNKLAHPRRDIIPLIDTEVNPIGMICLPVRFGDKTKSKNVEVDFLVVDVPTAYNVILGRTTLHKRERDDEERRKNKEKRGGYTSSSPLSSGPSSLEALASASKGIVASSPAPSPSPSPEGGINSISLGSRPSSSARWCSSVGLEIAILLKFLSCVTKTLRKYPKPPRSLQPWPLRGPLLAGVAGLSSRPLGHLDQPLAFPSAAGTGSLAPSAFGTQPWLSPSERTLRPLSPPPRLDEIGGWPLGARGRTVAGLRCNPHSLRGGGVFLETESAIPKYRGADRSAPASPRMGRGRRRGLIMTTLVRSKVDLLGLLVDEALPLLFLTVLGVGCHLRQSGIPGLKDHQPRPRLLYIKQKGSQARRGEEEVVSKKLQLREPIERFTITRLTLPPLRALHRFYCLSHKLRDGSGLILLPYVELEVTRLLSSTVGSPKGFLTGLPSFQSGTFSQPDSRWTKRKHISNASPLTSSRWHNLHGHQFILVQNLFNHQVKRKSETIVESRTINSYTFGGWLIHGGIRLGDYEERPYGRVSDCPDRPEGPGGSGPLETLELVDVPSEDECLDELLEEEEEEVSHEVELVLVEATSAPGFDKLGAEQGLPCVPSTNNSSRDLMWAVDLVFSILCTWKSAI